MKLYIEELYKKSKLKNNHLLEDISTALDRLRSLFRRDYLTDSVEYKNIKKRHEDERNGCERYLTSVSAELKPTMSFDSKSAKKVSFSADLSFSRKSKEKYQLCKMEADRKYYTSMLNLLKQSKDKICKNVNDHEKCKTRISDEIRKIERDLNTLEFVSKYLK